MTLSKEAFEKLVAEGFERLPQWVREKIKNVALLVEDEPSKEVRKREGLRRNETLLGYYHGIPLSARGEHYGVGPTMPDTITLYQMPIEEAAFDNIGSYELPIFHDAVRSVVAETIWHEFAHHFGMDEGEVRRREQGRRDRVE
ncbi:hypothetical protein A3A39_02580 [Candidatus Kaiserbacteria bacterium RIFCSPLOWO2_01_FULL_54_13]|uniref:Metallopeptidase family protein n=1 Tax=Candidatus Kaiserbacteria bacterium RIFCSPLOWO2_01_FULL_54_13 TaxID=1798512 RepID=A0A1F6F3H5_9BACT|nr:MAG: hypothetical protein A3A39_02580 [Candidatus Kaiserbacteria bacterium RIFCSPLOWO2_01_FULL_54_13]